MNAKRPDALNPWGGSSRASSFELHDPVGMDGGGGDAMPTWAWVLIIVLLLILVFGGFGYSRR
jgi:hypothetical protein